MYACVFKSVEFVTFVSVFCNDSFSMCHIATLMYGLGLDMRGFGLEASGLGLGLVHITEYSLLINVDKKKVMASDSITCRILAQNEQLQQVDTFPYLGSLITEDGECTIKFRTRLNKVQAIGASLQKIWKSYSIPKALVWPVTTYGCESWTLRKNEEARLVAFEMKGLRKILQVSWTTKTNEWVLNKAGIKRELLDSVKVRKLAYYGHTMRKQGSCLEKEILQRNNARCTQARKTTHWIDNIKTWTGLPVKESIRMSEHRDEW